MAYDKSRQGQGALFVNKNKKTETHPDRNGFIEITPEFWDVIKQSLDQAGGPVKMEVSGWIKQPKAGGETFLSLAAKEPYQKTGGVNKSSTTSGSARDEIPF